MHVYSEMHPSEISKAYCQERVHRTMAGQCHFNLRRSRQGSMPQAAQ